MFRQQLDVEPEPRWWLVAIQPSGVVNHAKMTRSLYADLVVLDTDGVFYITAPFTRYALSASLRSTLGMLSLVEPDSRFEPAQPEHLVFARFRSALTLGHVFDLEGKAPHLVHARLNDLGLSGIQAELALELWRSGSLLLREIWDLVCGLEG